MKRIALTFAILVALLMPSLAVSSSVAAVDVFPNCGYGKAAGTSTPEVCNEGKKGQFQTTNPIVSLIKIAITILSVVIGIAAVIGIILSGLKFITANGDASAVASARSSLIYALVGLAVVALAQVIVTFVLDKL